MDYETILDWLYINSSMISTIVLCVIIFVMRITSKGRARLTPVMSEAIAPVRKNKNYKKWTKEQWIKALEYYVNTYNDHNCSKGEKEKNENEN